MTRDMVTNICVPTVLHRYYFIYVQSVPRILSLESYFRPGLILRIPHLEGGGNEIKNYGVTRLLVMTVHIHIIIIQGVPIIQ